MRHHADSMRYDRMYTLLWIYAAALALFGLFLGPLDQILPGLATIVLTEDALITDYVLIAGPGAALINSALVTAVTLVMLRLSHEPFNGFSLVVVGLMSGFSLFGKNVVNIWPILLGSWLYAKLRREPFGKYVPTGLLSTALAPVISYIALDNGWGTPLLGGLVGVLIGFILPPLSAYTYKIQNGMNLYNVGFACGLLAFILVPLISSMGASPATRYHWAEGYDLPLGLALGIFCAVLFLLGLLCSGRPAWASWAGYRRLLLTSGRAPSDYLRMFGAGPVLINMGINGLIGIAFILGGGGDLNGPTVGGILTIMGFSAFGKHARNIIPVMAGVFLGGGGDALVPERLRRSAGLSVLHHPGPHLWLLRLALWGAGRISPLLGGALYRHAGGWNEPLQQRLFRGAGGHCPLPPDHRHFPAPQAHPHRPGLLRPGGARRAPPSPGPPGDDRGAGSLTAVSPLPNS